MVRVFRVKVNIVHWIAIDGDLYQFINVLHAPDLLLDHLATAIAGLKQLPFWAVIVFIRPIKVARIGDDFRDASA